MALTFTSPSDDIIFQEGTAAYNFQASGTILAGQLVYPNDTINFINAGNYILNQNAQRPYSYSQITGSTNKSLTLYHFYPFGGSHYSGQISPYAVEDGEMNNIVFTDLQNNTSKIRVWLKKI